MADQSLLHSHKIIVKYFKVFASIRNVNPMRRQFGIQTVCFYKKQNYSTQLSCTYRKSVPRTTAPKHIPAIPPIHQPTTLGTATSDTTFASRARVAVHLFEPFLKTFDRFCKKKLDGLMIYFSFTYPHTCRRACYCTVINTYSAHLPLPHSPHSLCSLVSPLKTQRANKTLSSVQYAF